MMLPFESCEVTPAPRTRMSATKFTLGVTVVVEPPDVTVGVIVTTSVTTFGYVMPQVRVGLVPVWTTVGNAVRVPTGTDGSVEVALTPDDPREVTIRMAAAYAANLLVFMAGIIVRDWDAMKCGKCN